MFLNRVVPSAVAAVAFSTLASAADMPVYKAQPQIETQATGYVELYTGWARTRETDSEDSDSFNGWVLGGAGRGTYFWTRNYSVQLDAQAEGTSYTSFGSRFSTHSYLVGGHANWRDPRGLVGVFAAAGDATSTFTSDIRHGLIGLEGQWYSGPLTLYGQVGYDSTLGTINSSFDSIQAWFVRGTARYYINPNFRLEGTVLYANGDTDRNNSSNTFDFETWLWRAKAEYKFAQSPFAVFVAYQGSRTNFTQSNSSSFRQTDDRVMGGIRLYLGEKTLQWNDNSGTTLDIIDVLGTPTMMFGGRSQ